MRVYTRTNLNDIANCSLIQYALSHYQEKDASSAVFSFPSMFSVDSCKLYSCSVELAPQDPGRNRISQLMGRRDQDAEGVETESLEGREGV